ncbi:ATP-dependent DNA helicase pif1 [Fusarium oxysporum f. sp. albedinis]|nr:ATP-dependent DNA helicase pif1 [Fusarium oxysporum f. sp. albedinis]
MSILVSPPIVSDNIEQLKELPIENRLFINGEFVPSKSRKTFSVVNPTTEEVSAQVFEAGPEDVNDAVAALAAAFPPCSKLGALGRAKYLFKLADALEKHLPELGYLDAITMAKPVDNDYKSCRSIENQGDTSIHTPGFVNLTFRQPYDVCAAINPWNAPVVMVTQKLGPDLITGNTLVVKISEKAPLSPLVLSKCCQEIRLPKGVVNILNGFGRPCGEKAIKKAAAESNLKNVTVELGGKSPLIVFEDADLEKAARASAFSILVGSVQACIASSRVFVQSTIVDEFKKALKTNMAQLRTCGDPLAAGTPRGPQVDHLQFCRVMGFLNEAKESGLEMVMSDDCQGETGYFIQPTIIKEVPEDGRVFREEVFGPVVILNTFDDEEEVLQSANNTSFGLYASVFTKDVSRALRVAKKVEAGNVGVNCTSPTLSLALDMLFGGWKQSGEGKEHSKYGTDNWTELKSVYITL